MNKEEILKSQLLKNIPINVIDQYQPGMDHVDDQQVSVYERDGNYYVLEGLEHILNMNGDGDQLVECFVTHKDSFL